MSARGSGNISPSDNRCPRRRRLLWVWFAAGFLFVFLGMCFGTSMYTLAPSGQGVVRCRLWEYYISEIDRAIMSTSAVGPTSGTGSAAITTPVEHLSVSAAGGLVMLAIGWFVGRRWSKAQFVSPK